MVHLHTNNIKNTNHINSNYLTEAPNMDFMDFSMFPQDQQQAMNFSHFGSENQDQYVPKAAFFAGSGNEDITKLNMNNFLTSNTNIVPQTITTNTLPPQGQKVSTNDSYDSSVFNSDDLFFSQTAAYNSEQQHQDHFNPLNNGLFNHQNNTDVHFVNGLLTPADNEAQEIYSLSSRDSNAPPSTVPSSAFGSATNLNFGGNHYPATANAQNYMNHYSPMTAPNSADVSYFNNDVFDQLPPHLDFRNAQLSSPLHSPKSGSFAEAQEAIYYQQQIQNNSIQRHSAKKMGSTDSLPMRSSVSNAGGVSKPSAKRSKTMGDLGISGINISNNVPTPIIYNPDVQNVYEWIKVSEITPERYNEILNRGAERKLSDVSQILDSFKQKHIMKKLNIINLKIGLKEKSNDEKPPRMNMREIPYSDSFEIICRTSSGYDTPVSEANNVLSGLRHLPILKDHINYKLYEELVSNGKPKDGKVKRPLNQFMLYRTAMIRAASIFKVAEFIKTDDLNELNRIEQELISNPKSKILDEIVGVQPKLDHHTTAQVIALLWKTEDPQVLQKFSNFAQIEKETHSKVYPNYKFNPQKKNSTSK
ncbi:Transcription factor [Wickerhamomyces ciferrii]|uniref:Transcription factor n=1 Tax=Wickerhamomyces ciferrii (strain ATCC 14091 / BCRC 22168 / CBS 111 / JCM 3599 / NBRC 0793 / NRRL Y-1031 F-60-10) TaxID=1206466 RepID=K0KM73_WICCF|nr:Transcription factor [Wickerhamomyces ciferrii]CCH46350.1 Transcription factor [Wickerhamomyces ciferrii]